jgi:uncharacterized MAPEG superfamily protein
MTIAFWCVLIAALLPMVWTGIAKMSGSGFPASGNHNPREVLESLDGYRKRAHWAQLNSYEAFPPFAAGVIIAQFVQATQTSIDYLAIAFIVFRVLYGICYVRDWAALRSVVWGAGFACVIGLFVVAA